MKKLVVMLVFLMVFTGTLFAGTQNTVAKQFVLSPYNDTEKKIKSWIQKYDIKKMKIDEDIFKHLFESKIFIEADKQRLTVLQGADTNQLTITFFNKNEIDKVVVVEKNVDILYHGIIQGAPAFSMEIRKK